MYIRRSKKKKKKEKTENMELYLSCWPLIIAMIIIVKIMLRISNNHILRFIILLPREQDSCIKLYCDRVVINKNYILMRYCIWWYSPVGYSLYIWRKFAFSKECSGIFS